MRISDWSSDVCSSDLAIADARISLVEQPADLGERDLRHAFALVLLDPLFRNQLKTIVLGNRRARLLKLLFVRRIDACCELAPRLVTLAARVRKTDGRPGAERQRAVSPEIFVVHAPQR